jgi:hypothetical protein
MPRRFVERMVLRLPAGSFARISAVLRNGEDRASFVRAAVEAALQDHPTDAVVQAPPPAASAYTYEADIDAGFEPPPLPASGWNMTWEIEFQRWRKEYDARQR